MELHSKLVGRIGSAREFGEFLSTEAGERFLAGLSSERPHERIISAVRGGVVFAVVGVTVVIAADTGALGNERDDLLVVAVILVGLGAGPAAGRSRVVPDCPPVGSHGATAEQGNPGRVT